MKNAMERLNESIKSKNSRICAVLNIDNIPEFFKNKFEQESDELIYEYAIAYLQAIAQNIPAVKITGKEKGKVYWDIVEAARHLGFFVICEIMQEDIQFGYILESQTKIMIENIDAVIINMDLGDNLEIERFIKLLKEKQKAAFINIRNSKTQEESNKKVKWSLFKKKAPVVITPREAFNKLKNNVERICYDQNGNPTYVMIGLVITKPDQIDILTPYNYAIFDEHEQMSVIASVAPKDGLGVLVTTNLYPEHTTPEDFFKHIMKKAKEDTDKINNAINEFYGIED